MTGTGPRMPGGTSSVMSQGSIFGPRMPAGKYTVKLIKGSETYASTVELIPDSRANYSADERALQQKSVRHLFDMTESFTFLTQRVMTDRDQALARPAKLSGADRKPLIELADKSSRL